ncbi:MAG: hemagglutinin, partial [Verrucomicrobia bacterium]|nr:hemagglutinin [Verrucomicrobiota bacterium]
MAGQLSGNVPVLGSGYLAWLASKGFTQGQFDTSGLVVDVTDSPIDNGTVNVNHFALYMNGTISNNSPSRVVYTRLEGTANSGSVTSAQDGHGNLNAHIIAGQVNLSGSTHVDSSGYHFGTGICPYVKVGGSIIFDTSNFTSPNYPNLASRAFRDGVRISSNSWGADTAGAYDVDAQSYDALVRDAQPTGSAVPVAGNQQMTFVFAAGNAGPGTKTVGSPGTAKNVITAGAAENVQPFGGADSSGVADTGADSANDVIDFSSRGPCSDSRAKPDIVAPGTHVSGGVPQATKTMSGTGTKLAIFDGSGVSGGVSSIYFPSAGQQFYTASSGTSHSTPGVAGAAALVYQYFVNQGWGAPSPAMLKGYMMNAARYLNGTYANDNLYSNNQGMGMVNLDTSFDGTSRFLRDQLTADIFTGSGQSRSWTGTIDSSTKPVRITVAWTDAPGSTTGNAYKNNLDLTVTVNGTAYRGNNFSKGVSIPGGTADARNNVESVFLPAGTTGTVTITVAGTNINSDGVPNYGTTIDQDFALVAYNFKQVDAAAVVLSGTTLVAEGNSPTNNAIDPGETVTVAFGLQNVGNLNASNVTATLLPTNGVTPGPTNTANYGTLTAGGSAVSNNFTFSASGALGSTFNAVLSLSSGTNSLGTVSATFLLGPPPVTPVLISQVYGGEGTQGRPTTKITSSCITAAALPSRWLA